MRRRINPLFAHMHMKKAAAGRGGTKGNNMETSSPEIGLLRLARLDDDAG